MIGKRPKTAPSVAARTASWAGIPKKITATRIATATAVRPAQWAFHFSTPRVTKIVTRGIRATRADTARLSATGEISGVNAVGTAASVVISFSGCTSSGGEQEWSDHYWVPRR